MDDFKELLTKTFGSLYTMVAGASAMLFEFIIPIKSFMGIVIVFTIVDFITGIWASKVKKIEIQSKRMGRTVTKITVYMIALITSNYFEVVFEPPVSFTYYVAGVVAITEFKSFFENLTSISNINILQKVMALIPLPFSRMFKNKNNK